MALLDAVSTLEKFVWILNHVSRSITWSLFTLKAWNLISEMTNLNMIFHVGVSLSIGHNLKLAPVPCWISEWPIHAPTATHLAYRIYFRHLEPISRLKNQEGKKLIKVPLYTLLNLSWNFQIYKMHYV